MAKVKVPMTMVVHNPDKGWDIKDAGKSKPREHFDRKQDAVDSARKISIKEHTELVISGKNGQIQQRDSHGNDPVKSKD